VIPLAFFTLLAFGVSVLVTAKAWSALRRKERFRFGFLDGGLLFMGKEVDPRWMFVAVAAYLTVVGALLAWPLGLYERLAERTSACRDLVSDEELQSLAPGFEPLHVHHLDTSCRSSSWGPGVRGRFEVEIQARGTRGAREALLARGARELDGGVLRLEEGDRVELQFVKEGGVIRVALSQEHFDEDAVGALARRLPERGPSLLAPFEEAHRAGLQRPGFLRRHAFWFVLGGTVAALVGVVVVQRLLAARAMRRVIDDE
jgi:hypothetical protein